MKSFREIKIINIENIYNNINKYITNSSLLNMLQNNKIIKYFINSINYDNFLKNIILYRAIR